VGSGNRAHAVIGPVPVTSEGLSSIRLGIELGIYSEQTFVDPDVQL